jgi:hypothetical protein
MRTIDPRNENLNAAYLPKWLAPENTVPVTVPQGDTRFDPFIGTGWGQMLDAMGASEPGGTRIRSGGGLPTSGEPFGDPVLSGLKKAVAKGPRNAQL